MLFRRFGGTVIYTKSELCWIALKSGESQILCVTQLQFATNYQGCDGIVSIISVFCWKACVELCRKTTH